MNVTTRAHILPIATSASEGAPTGRTWLILACLTATLAACEQKKASAETPHDAAPPRTSEAPAASRAAPSKVPAPSDPVTPAAVATCARICEHSRRLKCKHAEECRAQCIAMGSFTPCKEQFAVFYGCLVDQPDKNWECAEDGVGSIRDGFCNREQEAAVACMEVKMQQ